MKKEYPQLENKSLAGAIDIKQYIYDDCVDTSGKVLVVDWYYKVKQKDGKTDLQLSERQGISSLDRFRRDRKVEGLPFPFRRRIRRRLRRGVLRQQRKTPAENGTVV